MFIKKLFILTIFSLFFWGTYSISAQAQTIIDGDNAKIADSMIFDNGKYHSIYFSKKSSLLMASSNNIWFEKKIKKKGSRSIAFKLNSTETRIETKVSTLANNKTHFMKFSVFFSKNYQTPTHWNLFAQWWQGSPASPPIAFQLDTHSKNFNMEIIIRHGTVLKTEVKEIYNNEIEKNKWIDFIVEMRIDDTGGKKGVLKVWKNGEPILTYKGKLGYSDLNSSSDFRVGLYRYKDNKTVSLAYFDEIRVSNKMSNLKK